MYASFQAERTIQTTITLLCYKLGVCYRQSGVHSACSTNIKINLGREGVRSLVIVRQYSKTAQRRHRGIKGYLLISY